MSYEMILCETCLDSRMECKRIKTEIRNGEYDTDSYAIRMRRYPKENHLQDVITDTGSVW